MTGGQPTAIPSSRMEPLLLGLGVDPEHLHILDTHPKKVDRNAEVLRQEIDYEGLSVIVTVRECIETARDKKRAKPATAGVTA
jgi:indolepyruvate ferredoxin oxidoreductase alpha subunit